ncbi:unnamed protein product [Nippostrongylus brasiliensis]|uniref:Uncharacterized protein n=1 Tax=Nippostrongylus brasiliensis TaxID=27835 RepID=A0A0N4XSJ0_NIPBR|nr:unnamed protein product [Nippostrongylus brasiliensis]
MECSCQHYLSLAIQWGTYGGKRDALKNGGKMLVRSGDRTRDIDHGTLLPPYCATEARIPVTLDPSETRTHDLQIMQPVESEGSLNPT